MEAIRVEQVMIQDGQLVLRDLPYKRGQVLEVIVVPWHPVVRSQLTVGQLRRSGLIGMWKERADIVDSSKYARRLREQAQQRRRDTHDLVG